MRRPRVALVIPTLDEEEAIGGVIAAVPRDAVDKIIVVDSSSRDHTVERAQAAGAYVISLEQMGYGRACRAGVAAAADCDIVVFLDGDGSDRPELIPTLLAPLNEGRCDFAIGSRTRGKREHDRAPTHSGTGARRRDAHALRRPIQRYVPIPRDPPRGPATARHARG